MIDLLYSSFIDRPERGMVVAIYLDPTDPQRSTRAKLEKLENGEYGPFYGP